MPTEKPKTAIAEMLKKVRSASQTIEEGSEIRVLKKDSLNDPETSIKPLTNSPELSNKVIKISPQDCILWKFKDRTSCDLGNIDQLAEDIKLNGQSQPGIVRKLEKHNNKKYEIIVGERRWRACVKLGISFEAVVRDINDHDAAIIQASENLQRKDLSDYAKGMNYAKLISENIISQTELQKTLNFSKATMSALLSFSDIPSTIVDAIGDMSKVSAYVASIIRAYANKGSEYIAALIAISPNIRNGIGSDNLKKLVNSYFSKPQEIKHELITVLGKNKQKLFSLKTKNSKLIDISFYIPITNFKKIETVLLKAVREEVGEELELEATND